MSQDNLLPLKILTQAGRLLLEYNESGREIHRALVTTSQRLSNEECKVVISYDGVAVDLGGDGPVVAPVRELRFNAAVQAQVHLTLARIRRGELDPAAALSQLECVEVNVPRQPRWMTVLLLAAAAASLAFLLGGDVGAAVTSAAAVGLGVWARRALASRRFSLLTLPFAAALIGAVLGGVVIRLAWTSTPGLALIVPSLILVPGPHILNGLLDLIDNYIPLALARLALAGCILVATALGIIVGIELTLHEIPTSDPGVEAKVNLIGDMVLAGVVTCGFAMAYNTAWPHVAMAVVGGMSGHGLRYMALQAGWSLESATLLGGLSVGVVSMCLARSTKTPVAIIAFAGAVTMMPGLQMYRALGGAFQLANLKDAADVTVMGATLGNAFQAHIVAGALALGLVVGVRTVLLIAGREDLPVKSAIKS